MLLVDLWEYRNMLNTLSTFYRVLRINVFTPLVSIKTDCKRNVMVSTELLNF